MKKNITRAIGLVFALAFAGWASAQSMSNVYLGGGIGWSHIKLDSADTAGTTTKDEKDTGYKVFGGYRFNQTWAAELGYANLGEAKMTFPGGSAKGEASAWSLSAVGSWPVSDAFSILGKLGATSNRVATTESCGVGCGNSTKTKTGLLWGVGASYKFSPQMAARLEYENYGKFGEQVQATGNQTGRAKVDMISASLVFSF